MPHPQLLNIASDMVRKADDPVWFRRVHRFKKQSYLKYLRELVYMYKSKVNVLKASPPSSTHDSEIKEMCMKEQQRIQAMLTYLHNGNRAKYEEYKMKAKQTMSDLLTMYMEADGIEAEVVTGSRDKLEDGTVIVSVGHTGDVVRNEQLALRQGKKMKMFNENVEFYDLCAEFLELYK
jgi:hypothetical protein